MSGIALTFISPKLVCVYCMQVRTESPQDQVLKCCPKNFLRVYLSSFKERENENRDVRHSQSILHFLSEVIFIVLPITAIIGMKVHNPAYTGSIFSGKELPIASILLCGSAIRRRYMLNYKQIGQRQIEDQFVMDILIALLTASSLLFSFVALANDRWKYMEPAQVIMFLVSLVSVYIVYQVEEKTYQYLRKPPVKQEIKKFFRLFRSELVQVENYVDDCANIALGITADLIAANHSYCDSKLHVEDLQLDINLDHLRNIVSRFQIIQRRCVIACNHLKELEKSVQAQDAWNLKGVEGD